MPLKAQDVRNMSEAEIVNKVVSLKDELLKMRVEKKAGRVEKPHRIRQARREIARCYTILREKSNAGKAR